MAIPPDEARQMVLDLDPWKTIFYYSGSYHGVVNDRLTEIPAAEAEVILLRPDWSLWNLGDPPGKLPESCPAWICSNLYINGSAEEFLSLVLHAHYQESIISNLNNN